jgi:cytochrome c oxidase subunit 2
MTKMLALEMLAVHTKFTIIVMVILILVLGIMIYSIVMHHKRKKSPVGTFAVHTIRSQIFWTLIPFAILFYIDFILMRFLV